MRNAYRLCVTPVATTRLHAALHCLLLAPGNAHIARLPSSPIFSITHCQSGTHAGDTPAQTPTQLRSHICICPNEALVCQAQRTTKTQAPTHSAPFTKRHRTATGTQPKRPRHKQKSPKQILSPPSHAIIVDTRAALPSVLQIQTHWLNQQASVPRSFPASLTCNTLLALPLDLPHAPK